MPINSFLYPAPSNSDNFEVANSLRFNDGSSDTLTRTVSSAGNRRTFTYSGWIKRSTISTGQGIFGQGDYTSSTGSDHFNIRFESSGTIRIEPSGFDIKTNALHRDPSAWYHIVVAIDTTQSTESNRVKMYINGNQVTSFATATYPSQNEDTQVNTTGSTGTVYLGDVFNGTGKFDGYMAEVCFIDGQQLDATSFGEFDNDTNIWKPKEVLTQLDFGTNGFYLQFKNASSLGTDSSTNGNNFTVNNLTSIDQTTDTCTNNFCTLNPLDNDSSTTFSEGNCKAVTDSSLRKPFYSTFGLTEGKWYWEIKMIDIANFFMAGISGSFTSTNEPLGYELYDYGIRKDNGAVRNNDTDNSYAGSYADNDIVGIALDLDNNKLYYSVNGTFQNSADPSAGTGGFSISASSDTEKGSYTPAGSDFSTGGGSTVEFNFGNPPYSISSGNSDGNGYGNFEYSVPSGYYALNTKNLAEYG